MATSLARTICRLMPNGGSVERGCVQPFLIFLALYFAVGAIARTADANHVDVVQKALPATAAVDIFDSEDRKLSVGSGFFVENGVLVTNHHVIDDAVKARVRLPDGTSAWITRIISKSKTDDLALCQIDMSRGFNHGVLPVSAKTPQAGERVILIGTPCGMAWTVSDGMVTGLRSIKGRPPALQHSAASYPGSSGGPLLNTKGEVVGVMTFAMKEAQTLNFAIPANRVHHLLLSRPVRLADAHKAFKAENYTESLQIAQRVLRREPNNHKALALSGRCHLQVSDPERAVEVLTRAVRLNPSSANWNNLGVALARGGEQQLAAICYASAMRIDPANTVAAGNLAEADTGLLRNLAPRGWSDTLANFVLDRASAFADAQPPAMKPRSLSAGALEELLTSRNIVWARQDGKGQHPSR